ncbi:hypothetical protein Golax_001760, partial [Gossypium laxum]|nr:hypothetical protein [Gossypium laxum]
MAEVLAANDLECDDMGSRHYGHNLCHGLNIYQEGKSCAKDTLKLGTNAESAKDEEAVGAKTESKSETTAPESKSENEKSNPCGKKDGGNPPAPKAPVSFFLTTDITSLQEVPPDNEFEKRIRPEATRLAAQARPNQLATAFNTNTFADIGALDETKESLQEMVMLPLRRPDLFKGGLLKPCRGILLFGPPGTGKTMLAKAIANEAGASFINVSMSTITSKWFGEDEKNVRALFTLAAKVAPTIIFVDEVDSMLGQRNRVGEHEAMRKIKNEFMTHWDGLLTKAGERILVLA